MRLDCFVTQSDGEGVVFLRLDSRLRGNDKVCVGNDKVCVGNDKGYRDDRDWCMGITGYCI